MPADYTILAPLYDMIGLSDFARTSTPAIISSARQLGWTGRSVLDLGCGTGVSARWLAENGFAVQAVDASPDMLAAGRAAFNSAGLNLAWRHDDARTLHSRTPVDLVLALDLINDLPRLEDVEQIFTTAYRALEAGKLFVFDLHTDEGLVERARRGGSVIYDTPTLVVFAESEFDDGQQAATHRYTFFRRQHEGGDTWRRERANQVLHGYPVAQIATLLEQTGFSLAALRTPQLEPFDLRSPQGARVIIFAQKAA